MAFFHTELLELTRNFLVRSVRFMGSNPGDPEDPHDNIYLSETSRKYTKVSQFFFAILQKCSIIGITQPPPKEVL